MPASFEVLWSDPDPNGLFLSILILCPRRALCFLGGPTRPCGLSSVLSTAAAAVGEMSVPHVPLWSPRSGIVSHTTNSLSWWDVTRDCRATAHSLHTSRDVQRASLPGSGQKTKPLCPISVTMMGKSLQLRGDERAEVFLGLWTIPEICSSTLNHACVPSFMKYS